MVRTGFRFFFQALGAMTLIVAVSVAVVGWKLTEGPLALNFLSPYLERALSAEDGGYAIRVEGTELSWSGWRRTLDLKTTGLTALDAQGQVLASVPELYLRLSGKALFMGMIAPKTVELRSTRVRLNRTSQGDLEFGLGETTAEDAGGGDFVASLIGELLAEPKQDRATGYLSRVLITDARVLVDDAMTGTRWEASRVDLDLQRDIQGIAGEGSVSLGLPEGEARIELVATYNSQAETLDLGLGFEKIKPSDLAKVVPPLEPAKALDLPLSGTVAMTLRKSGEVDSITFEVKGGEGRLTVPEPLAVDYPIKSIALEGSVGDGFSSIVVDAAKIDLGGPMVEASAEVRGLGGDQITVKSLSTVRDLPLNLLAAYWPATLAPEAHDWVAHNLLGGTVTDSRFQIDLAGQSLASLGVVVLDGEARAEGAVVGYIDGMPQVHDGRATAKFSPDDIVIGIEHATVEKLTATGGSVRLFGLSQYDQFAAIRLEMQGAIPDALAFIDNKPLGFASALGIVPGKTSGTAKVSASLDFPLLKTLGLADVKVKAKAALDKASVEEALFGQNLTDGTLALVVGNDGMTVDGEAVIGGVAAKVNWEENFGKAPVRSRYKLAGVLDEAARARFGLVPPAEFADMLAGTVAGELNVTMDAGGRGALGGQFDLRDAKLALKGFEWEKPVGEPGAASLSMRFSDSGVQDIPRFSISVPGREMEVVGSLNMSADRKSVESAHMEKFKLGRTDVAGEMRFNPDGSRDIEVGGAVFDATPFLTLGQGDKGALTGVEKSDLPTTSAHVEVGRVWVGPDRYISEVIADVTRDDDRWNSLNLIAEITDGKPLRIGITPFQNVRDLSVTCEDAGSLLRTFGFYDKMEQGSLDLQGTIDLLGTISGKAQINDFKVRRAPVLASLLSLASLTGIFDLLQGEGITFTQFDMPFTYASGLLATENGRTYGPALGLTFSGHADMDKDTFDIDGEVVPSYTLNSLLGNIPLVGRIFSGEKGGGLIGVNYSMSGSVDNPRIIVNPLSALTPGFLRNIFNIFDTSPDPEKLIEQKTREKAQGQAPTAGPPPQ